MTYQNILFDLDGTLTDSKEGITKGVAYALKALNIPAPDLDELEVFIGPPLDQSFREYYHLSEEDTVLAVKKYREYYNEIGLYENVVYDGVEELLIRLKEAGKNLYVATSKPEVLARKIIAHFNLDKYFMFIGGSGLNKERNSKAEVIEYVLKEAGITDLGTTVMIGDRKHDMIGAKETNLKSIGVLYGYGDEEELRSTGAMDIAADTDVLFAKLTD